MKFRWRFGNRVESPRELRRSPFGNVSRWSRVAAGLPLPLSPPVTLTWRQRSFVRRGRPSASPSLGIIFTRRSLPCGFAVRNQATSTLPSRQCDGRRVPREWWHAPRNVDAPPLGENAGFDSRAQGG